MQQNTRQGLLSQIYYFGAMTQRRADNGNATLFSARDRRRPSGTVTTREAVRTSQFLAPSKSIYIAHNSARSTPLASTMPRHCQDTRRRVTQCGPRAHAYSITPLSRRAASRRASLVDKRGAPAANKCAAAACTCEPRGKYLFARMRRRWGA